MAANGANQALQSFLKAKVNSVSRERIFHNKLFFDLKLAAARDGYHLSVFEPEVDRDAFDVFLDDGDNERRIQIKTVLASSATANWNSTKRFMRPGMLYRRRLGLVPGDCGAGGGFLLIEIDDSSPLAPVTYYYTDYFVATALVMRLLCEKTQPARKVPGRKKKSRQETAAKFLSNLSTGDAVNRIRLPKPIFVKLNSPDSLLALMNLHSTAQCYLPSDKVLEAIEQDFLVGADCNPVQEQDMDCTITTVLRKNIEGILTLLDEPDLQIFNSPPWQNKES
jgi:hypothetical protein